MFCVTRLYKYGSCKAVSLASRLSLIAADIIVLAITWIKTFRHVEEASQLGVSVSVSATLLRDGEILHVIFLPLLY